MFVVKVFSSLYFNIVAYTLLGKNLVSDDTILIKL